LLNQFKNLDDKFNHILFQVRSSLACWYQAI